MCHGPPERLSPGFCFLGDASPTAQAPLAAAPRAPRLLPGGNPWGKPPGGRDKPLGDHNEEPRVARRFWARRGRGWGCGAGRKGQSRPAPPAISLRAKAGGGGPGSPPRQSITRAWPSPAVHRLPRPPRALGSPLLAPARPGLRARRSRRRALGRAGSGRRLRRR